MENKEMIFEGKNITKQFPGVLALDDVYLNIFKGEVLALIGENGAGKSTLMKILLGDIQLTSGEMMFKGKTYQPKSPNDALELGISMIHQEISLVHYMTVSENIWLGREDKFTKFGLIDSRKRHTETVKLLETLGLDIDPNKIVSGLSIANMQLVEIARAVSYDSDIIIMDEPTSALTNVEIEKLYKVISDLAEQGKSIIFISHKLDEIFEVSDRITILRDGKYIETNNTEAMNEDMLVKLMVGRDITEMYPKEDVEIGEVALEVINMTGAEKEFTDISFNVRKGEILGFCGLMGAGRSEIMEGLFGISKIESGTVKLHGEEIEINSTGDAIENKLAMVTEDRLRRGAIHKLSVRENLSIAYLDSITKNGFVDEKQEVEDANRMVKAMSVKTAGIGQLIGSLSGGNQQKVIIGKWLLTEPEVLILDEPTRGIDVGAKSEIYKLIGSLAKMGKAIIVVSSELPEVMGICDRILVVREGKIVGESIRDEFSQEKLMSYAFGVKENIVSGA